MKLTKPELLIYTIGAIGCLLLIYGGLAIKAHALNSRYGTDFTAWDILFGVDRNFREVKLP